jgi:hypothetical protein
VCFVWPQQIVGNTIVLHDPADIVGSSPCAVIELVHGVRDHEEEEPSSGQGRPNATAAKNVTAGRVAMNNTEQG